jgi:4'-phosphopantetheinyl transferase
MFSAVRDRREPQVAERAWTGPARHPTTRSHGWGPGDVHLWTAATGSRGDHAADLAMLDDAEQARTGRFRYEADRIRFAHGRAFTRRVLGHYLGVRPTDVRIRISASGQPKLDPVHGISFSTSRDHDLATVAVAAGCAVGVDVEWLRPIEEAMEVSRRFFAPAEDEWLRSLRPEDRVYGFLCLWTRKESYVKALGRGLSIPLGSFIMLTEDGASAGQARDELGVLPYAFTHFDAPGGYVGAVTVAGPHASIRYMDSSRDLR